MVDLVSDAFGRPNPSHVSYFLFLRTKPKFGAFAVKTGRGELNTGESNTDSTRGRNDSPNQAIALSHEQLCVQV